MTKIEIAEKAVTLRRGCFPMEFRGFSVKMNKNGAAPHYSLLNDDGLFDCIVWLPRGSTAMPSCSFKTGDVVVAVGVSSYSRGGKYGCQMSCEAVEAFTDTTSGALKPKS